MIELLRGKLRGCDDRERGDGGGNAAERQQEHDAARDVACRTMGKRPRGLGHGSACEVGPDRNGCRDAERGNEQRRHDGTAADPGESDDQPDAVAGKREQAKIDYRHLRTECELS